MKTWRRKNAASARADNNEEGTPPNLEEYEVAYLQAKQEINRLQAEKDGLLAAHPSLATNANDVLDLDKQLAEQKTHLAN